MAGSIRFTATEIEELAELGIDIDGVKSADDFAAALATHSFMFESGTRLPE